MFELSHRACSINTKKFLRSEALAYLVSELVTCLDAVCFSLLVEEAAINYGCRKRQNLGRNLKQSLIKPLVLFKKIKLVACVIKLFTKAQI